MKPWLLIALIILAFVIGIAFGIGATIVWELTYALTPQMEQSREVEEGKAPPTFLSPTECIGADGKPAHGTWRWAAKVDEDDSFLGVTITSIADVALWQDVEVTSDSPRRDSEQEWFELGGEVVLVKCEDDGDLHVQLGTNVTGVQMVVEVPLGKPWDKIRKEVWSWAEDEKFPCKPHKLKLAKHPIVKVTGKAFYDGYHKGKISNRRSYDNNVTVWEIHPVMKLEVIGE